MLPPRLHVHSFFLHRLLLKDQLPPGRASPSWCLWVDRPPDQATWTLNAEDIRSWNAGWAPLPAMQSWETPLLRTCKTGHPYPRGLHQSSVRPGVTSAHRARHGKRQSWRILVSPAGSLRLLSHAYLPGLTWVLTWGPPRPQRSFRRGSCPDYLALRPVVLAPDTTSHGTRHRRIRVTAKRLPRLVWMLLSSSHRAPGDKLPSSRSDCVGQWNVLEVTCCDS